MKVLCIDTTLKSLTVGIADGGKGCFYSDEDAELKHSQRLLGVVDSVLAQDGSTLQDMHAFLAVCGPGSFTGIRIGLTTVRAFAQFTGKPCICVNSLQLKAYNVKTCKKYVVPLIDAMQNKVYYSVFDSVTGKQLCEPDVCPEVGAVEAAEQAVCADAADMLFLYDKELDGQNKFFTKYDIVKSLADIAADRFKSGQLCHYSELLPMYAALSQAEKNLCK